MKRSIEQQLQDIHIGTYLKVWGDDRSGLSPCVQTGWLISINWVDRTLLLHNRTYNREAIVSFDRIMLIDEGRNTVDVNPPPSGTLTMVGLKMAFAQANARESAEDMLNSLSNAIDA